MMFSTKVLIPFRINSFKKAFLIDTYPTQDTVLGVWDISMKGENKADQKSLVFMALHLGTNLRVVL